MKTGERGIIFVQNILLKRLKRLIEDGLMTASEFPVLDKKMGFKSTTKRSLTWCLHYDGKAS